MLTMNTNNDDYDDDLLRHYYEQELEFLRRDMRSFMLRHPEAAARLSINGDGHSDDPGVERLVQSTALLHARHSAKIDDDYPEFSEALTRMLYPQYLRPFPSCSVVQFHIGEMFDSLTESVMVARGTQLLTKTGRLTFCTAYDVALAPLRVAYAKYMSAPVAPACVTLPPDTSGLLSIGFCGVGPDGARFAAMPATLRVYLAGPACFIAALMDTLLLRAATAYVEDCAGRCVRLPSTPVAIAGFGPRDWLFTDPVEPGQAFGLLGEYFAFADRFRFIDIDFAALRAAAPGERLTLHLAVDQICPNSRIGQQLVQLHADHLKLFCTPVVNLFQKKGVALKFDPLTGAWPLQVQAGDDALTEVWSIDRVRTEQCNVVHSSASLISRQADGAGLKWTLAQRGEPISTGTSRMTALSVAGVSGVSGSGKYRDPLRVDVTCSNGDLPRSLDVGSPQGDMRMEDNGNVVDNIALLRAPTAVAWLPRRNGALWRLISQQTPQPIRLGREGLPELKQMLYQFATLSPSQARHIDGITGLSRQSVMTMMMRGPQPAMVRGLEITLEIDERLFAENSVAVFAHVMERFFAPYAPTNSFVRLVVMSANGALLWRGEPVRGASPLL